MTEDNYLMEKAIRELLHWAGEDFEREGLRETPVRYLKALKFWCSGYKQDPKDILKTFTDGSEKYDELVFQGHIPLYSMCEHHITPWFGVAHIGYLPRGKIVGLSKLARLVEIFARRLTVQERVSTQIADALMTHLQCKGCGVVIQARHLCLESRGVQKPGTITTTSALRGAIKADRDVRAEFLSFVQTASEHGYEI